MPRATASDHDAGGLDMAKQSIPATQAVRALRQAGVAFELHSYRYEEKGGTAVAARELGWDEHAVIKTLVFVDDQRRPLIVLMHGDRQVSAKNLARAIGAKAVSPADPALANRLTGYQVGGISLFGQKAVLPVYVEKTILDLPRILINAGRRGLLAEVDPAVIGQMLTAAPVEAAV